MKNTRFRYVIYLAEVLKSCKIFESSRIMLFWLSSKLEIYWLFFSHKSQIDLRLKCLKEDKNSEKCNNAECQNVIYPGCLEK